MRPVLVTPGAILAILDAFRVLAAVLRLEEVPAAALGALEDDLVSGHF
jgi:hypothetical protein